MITLHRLQIKVPTTHERPLNFPPRWPYWHIPQLFSNTGRTKILAYLEYGDLENNWPEHVIFNVEPNVHFIEFNEYWKKPEWWEDKGLFPMNEG